MEVTREQLARALDHLWVYAQNREGIYHGQLSDAIATSHALWENLAAQAPDGPVTPDAHVCEDECPADPELHAMAALLPALPLVSGLGHDARERVMDWARRRATDGLPPF